MRCVRYCDEVMDAQALAAEGRGTLTQITHWAGNELECDMCGGCIQICPVGAITSRLSMYDYRPWMLKTNGDHLFLLRGRVPDHGPAKR